MTNRAARQSADDWFQIIAEFHQSGLSAEEFCLHRGYANSTFNRWRLRHAKQQNPASGPSRVPRSAFIEAVASESGSVTITVGESVQVDCPVSLGIEQIARLARAMATDERV